MASNLKTYEVEIAGIKHTLRLSDKDRDRLGVKDAQEVKAGAAANKAGTAENKSK